MNTEQKVAMKIIRRRRRVERKRRWFIFRWQFDREAIRKRHMRLVKEMERRKEDEKNQRERALALKYQHIPWYSKIIIKLKNLWNSLKMT